jgi:hypothetical protein
LCVINKSDYVILGHKKIKMDKNKTVNKLDKFEYDLNLAIQTMMLDMRNNNIKEMHYQNIDISSAVQRYLFTLGMNNSILLKAYNDLQNGNLKNKYIFDSEAVMNLAMQILGKPFPAVRLEFNVPISLKIKIIFECWMPARIGKQIFKMVFRRNLLPPMDGKSSPAVLCFAHHQKFVRLIKPLIHKLSVSACFAVHSIKMQRMLGLANEDVVPYVSAPCPKGLQSISAWREIYMTVNKLEAVIQNYKPRLIVLAEGDAPYHEILAALGSKYQIPTVCLQWGAFTQSRPHMGFRDLHHSFFLAWGEAFIQQLKPFSPRTLFLSVGNPSVEHIVLEPRKRIVFLLQGVDAVQVRKEHWDKFLIFMISIIHYCEDWEIVVREHPNLPLADDEKNELEKYSSVEIHNPRDKSLTESLDSASLAVTMFSSALLDAVAMGIVPFIFNPSNAIPRYQPDIEEYGIGIECKALDEAIDSMKQLIDQPIQIKLKRKRLFEIHPFLFANIGLESRRRIVNIFRSILDTGSAV